MDRRGVLLCKTNRNITYKNIGADAQNGFYSNSYTIGTPIDISPYLPKIIYIEAKRNSSYDRTTKITRIYFYRLSQSSYYGIKSYIQTGNETIASIDDVSNYWNSYFEINDNQIYIKYNPSEGGLSSTEYQKVALYY